MLDDTLVVGESPRVRVRRRSRRVDTPRLRAGM